MILLVVWVVLMVLWLALGIMLHDSANPKATAGLFIPWACVLILGIVVFGGYAPPAAALR